MNILFVCRFNRFRSKVAEAMFNKINKNKRFKARSAGIIKGNPISKEIKETARKFGILIQGTPIGLSSELLKWQDMTVIVADDVPKQVFRDNKKYGKKIIIWKIPDADEETETDMLKRINMIHKRIERFLKQTERL